MGLSDEILNKVPAKLGIIIDGFGNNVDFQVSNDGGSVNLSLGKIYEAGFRIAVAGNEGLLRVRFVGKSTFTSMPFFSGWNPLYVAEVAVYSGNTATDVYWGK